MINKKIEIIEGLEKPERKVLTETPPLTKSTNEAIPKTNEGLHLSSKSAMTVKLRIQRIRISSPLILSLYDKPGV